MSRPAEYYEDQRTAYAMAETYDRHNHEDEEDYEDDVESFCAEETREYAGECPYCNGRGWQSAGPGDTRQYTCPDCGGSGEIWECKECGKECGDYCEDCFAECRHCHGIYKADAVHDGYCPSCEWAKEENKHKQAVNA